MAYIVAEGGQSNKAKLTVWLGYDYPKAVTNLKLTREGNTAILTWEAPTIGMHGGYVNPDELNYVVSRTGFWTDQHVGTTFTEDMTGKTGNYQYYVRPVQHELAGEGLYSNEVFFGPEDEAWDVPYELFFTGNDLSSCIIIDANNDGTTWTYNWGGEEQSMILGKVSLKGAANLVLRLNVASYFSVGDKLLIEVCDNIYGPYHVIKTITFDDPALESWTPIEVSLAEFADRDYIHLSFHAIPAAEDCNIFIDEIEVRDVLDHDAAITAFSVSDNLVEVGKTTADVNVTVTNRGVEDLIQGDYTVLVYVGDRVIGTYEGRALQPYENWNITCQYVPESADPSPVAIYALIEYRADQDLSNNRSDSYEVKVIKPELPAVELLTAVKQGGNTMLMWSEPDLSGSPVQVVTDDFEDYIPFDINRAGDWTFYDEDGLPTTTNYYFPGREQPMAYIVMNPGMVQRLVGTLADTWPAHSGEQYMATFCAVGGDNDDWMVSPELSGNAQTITFYAKFGSETHGHEMFEVYYSTDDNTIESMIQTGDEVYKVPSGEWTMYSVEVPEGAKFFAIRCISHDRCALMIDDVTYESAAHPLEVQLVGYNVYCNGELITPEPITELFYLIPGIDQNASYYVTAVYDLGESEPSNVVSVTSSGIDEMTLDEFKGDETIYDLQGREVLSPERGQVYVKKGKKFLMK